MTELNDKALLNLFGGQPLFLPPSSATSANVISKSPFSGIGSITPLSCADVNGLPDGASGFSLNRHRAGLISLVGIVRHCSDTDLIIDDRTGWLTCLWPPQSNQQPRTVLVINGSYAKVIGKIQRDVISNELGAQEAGSFVIKSVHVEPVMSINGLTSHMLQISRAKMLYLTEEVRNQTQDAQVS